MKCSTPVIGKTLRVNLTTGKIEKESTETYNERFLGGAGIDTWLLYKEVKPGTEAFDPFNRLIFSAGILVGTLAPCAARLNIVGKSPVTGGIGAGSVCGHFSSELKFAGFDRIVITGRAKELVYLWINDDQVEIVDASSLKGATTWETDDFIKEQRGSSGIQIASIGPAGENLVKASSIIVNRGRSQSKCGLGAVMGSKNLKAIAVRGTGGIEVASPDELMELIARAWQKANKSEYGKLLKHTGTYGFMTTSNEIGAMAERNFQDEYMDPERFKKIAPHTLNEYEEKRIGYRSCPLHCGHFYRINQGPYAGLACEGVHCNDGINWASKLGIDYPPAIIKAHGLCSEYGLDQDNASGAISWAFECYQRGIITKDDTDGLELNWGDHQLVMDLIRKIAYREGFGDLLAECSKRASDLIGRGSEKYSINVKGQDSIETMRPNKGWALGCVVSTRGGGHLRGAPLTEYIKLPPEVGERYWGVPSAGDGSSYEGKARLVTYYEKVHVLMNCLGLCTFVSDWGGPDLLFPEDLAQVYSKATGIERSGEDLMHFADRIHNIEKAFNTLHSGFDRDDDYPPERFMTEPVPSGPSKGAILQRDDWDKMLDEYYELHSWSKKNGWQTRKCLEELDLKEVADDLAKEGRLT